MPAPARAATGPRPIEGREKARAEAYACLRFFTGPNFLRAAFSHWALLEPFFLWQAFKAALSFCARVRALVFLQPVTVTGVSWLRVAPFCPTKSEGIFNPPLTVHRFPFAASAEYFPSGNVSVNVLKGWSGTVLNVVLVTPALLMNVVPTKSTVTP